MDNGRFPALDSQASIDCFRPNGLQSRVQSARTSLYLMSTEMKFQSLCVDNAIFLQWLQICTSSSGASNTSTPTNSSSGRHSTKILAKISGGVRRMGDISA